MRFFDGQQWHDVALPPEITELGRSMNLGVRVLHSDLDCYRIRIFEHE